MEALEGVRAEEGQSQTQLLPARGLGGSRLGRGGVPGLGEESSLSLGWVGLRLRLEG